MLHYKEKDLKKKKKKHEFIPLICTILQEVIGMQPQCRQSFESVLEIDFPHGRGSAALEKCTPASSHVSFRCTNVRERERIADMHMLKSNYKTICPIKQVYVLMFSLFSISNSYI
jgi:hypothetical protein